MALCLSLGCSEEAQDDGGSGGSAGAGGAAGAGSSLVWSACADYPDEQCSELAVPRHWDAPDGEQISLRLLRIPAQNPEQRIGTLIAYLNGAGAGIKGLMAYRPLLGAMFPEVGSKLDIVAFDRRGFGTTATFECVDDAWVEKLRKTRLMPQTSDEWAAVDAVWKEYNERCDSALSPRGWLDSEQMARDVEAIRVALGEPTTTFLSTGYSGLAVARHAALFPDKLRVAVIDAPVPAPEADVVEWYVARAGAYDTVLDDFFAACAADAGCAFHGGATPAEVAQAYDALAAQIRATPLTVGGRTLGDRDLAEAVARVLAGGGAPNAKDLASIVAKLGPTLAEAEAGDGTKLLELADDAFTRNDDGTYLVSRWSSFPGLVLADHPCPAGFDVAAAGAVWAKLQTTAPRLGAVTVGKALVCLHGKSRSAPLDLGASSAPPLALFAGAHDPVSPLDSAKALATTLGNGSTVVEYKGYGGPYISRSACVRESISDKLLDPSGWTPPSGNACQ